MSQYSGVALHAPCPSPSIRLCLELLRESAHMEHFQGVLGITIGSQRAEIDGAHFVAAGTQDMVDGLAADAAGVQLLAAEASVGTRPRVVISGLTRHCFTPAVHSAYQRRRAAAAESGLPGGCSSHGCVWRPRAAPRP